MKTQLLQHALKKRENFPHVKTAKHTMGPSRMSKAGEFPRNFVDLAGVIETKPRQSALCYVILFTNQDEGDQALILDENEKPMVAAHVCWNDSEASVIQSVLRDGGIESQLNSEVPHSVLPIKTAGLGKVEVLVRQEDLQRAKDVIANHLDNTSEGAAE